MRIDVLEERLFVSHFVIVAKCRAEHSLTPGFDGQNRVIRPLNGIKRTSTNVELTSQNDPKRTVPYTHVTGYWRGRATCVVAALWPERCTGLVSVNS
jgi:hypothetical protein